MRHVILALTLLFLPAIYSGCSTPPNERVAQVQTLKMVGHVAETAVASSAQLYRDGIITAEQARQINEIFDNKFQPLFRQAAVAVQMNLSMQAPEELIILSTQLANLVIQFQTKK